MKSLLRFLLSSLMVAALWYCLGEKPFWFWQLDTSSITNSGKTPMVAEIEYFKKILRPVAKSEVIGFFGDESDKEHFTQRYYLAQYILAPRVLVKTNSERLLIGYFPNLIPLLPPGYSIKKVAQPYWLFERIDP